MTPLLEGLDGVKKMSKSLGNYIGINEDPVEIFGKVMSISDELMIRYYEVLTDADLEVVRSLHPKEAKLQLAEQIVGQFYSEELAGKARLEFERVFSQRQVPEDVVEYRFKKDMPLVDALVGSGMVDSKNEARRLIKQGAVSFEGQRIDQESWPVREGVLKIGKRRFLKLIP